MNSLQRRISSTKNQIQVEKDTKVVCMIKINGAGALESVTVKQSSGIKALDQEALARVKQAAPFGPMPAAFKTGLNLTYTFQFKAPIRNTEQSKRVDTGPYIESLTTKVSSIWKSPEVPKECSVTVQFILDAQGNVISIKPTKSSGFTNVDQAAMAAVKKAGPFGKLPSGLKQLPVNYMFSASPTITNNNRIPEESPAAKNPAPQTTTTTSSTATKTSSKEKVTAEIKELEERLRNAASKDKKAEILTNIGRNYRKIDDFENATKSFERAAKILKDENSANEALLKAELAEAYRKNGDTKSAIKFYEEAVQTLRLKPKENREELKKLLQDYADTLKSESRMEEANQLYTELSSLK